MREREMGSSDPLIVQEGVQVKKYGYINTTTPIFGSRIQDHKITKDEVHPDYPKTGGPLSIQALTVNYNAPRVKTGYIDPVYGTENTIDCSRVCNLYSGSLSFPSDALDTCASYGPDGWSRYQPRHQSAGLLQFLIELRDFPKMFKGRLDHFRDIGKGWLNYSFGWLPFLRDVRDFFQTQQKIDAQLLRLKQQNGKWLKRGGTLLDTKTSANDEVLDFGPQNGCVLVSKKRTLTHTERVWFSASFRFFIPDLEKGTWGVTKAHKRIWGLEMTPNLLWELVPYSWLVDWCSNASATIRNLTAITADNLVAKNAYVMRHEKTKQVGYVRAKGNLAGPQGNHYSDFSCGLTITAETKCRSVASPYGFRLDWPDFTPFQLSILAALGISRF